MQRVSVSLKCRGDLERQLLSQFHTPLVVGVDAPDGAFDENDVLVQSDELADNARSEGRSENRRSGPVAAELAGGHAGLTDALGAHLVGGFSECERLGLGKEVRHEQRVDVLAWLDSGTVAFRVFEGVCGICDGDEICGDQACALMNELEKSVLAVRARFTPVNLAGVRRCR